MSVPRLFAAAALIALALIAAAHAEPPTAAATNPRFDPALAQELGADEYGMRSYVLVLLRSSDHPVPQGPERAAMFKGHLANIRRLARGRHIGDGRAARWQERSARTVCFRSQGH